MTTKKNTYVILLALITMLMSQISLIASSHREAPLIANDPLADNVDLYAFRSPDNPDMITIIATYVPMQIPFGGPNYFSFGENIRYEIHVDNDASIPGDEVTYRFTFNKVNEDPSTFFNIRLGKQNLKTTYTMERSMDGGATWTTIISNGIVPPNNIGPRSIESGVGLGTSYTALFNGAITNASTGERVFAGPTDDPFFVDLGGIFDLGDAPRQVGKPVDCLACLNVSAIAIQVPISTLLKKGAPTTPANILDPNYVIGVWASASRRTTTTLGNSPNPTYDGGWVQVSRLGMPLTNEAVIPIGSKDYWNSITPYDEISETTLDEYFYNPELALYMDDDLFGGAVPGFAPLRIQKNSLGAFDFTNGADGLYGLKGNPALAGTALDDAVFGTLLLPGPGKPRSVDLWPAFHTGVPNVIPYQLATGKNGNPLAAGKPFVNNFLPNGGDMLRLNMAVPATPRSDASFSSLGLIQAAVLGLTAAPYNTNTNIEFIPNMDGFPNGRRLEDDVTRIELQAVAGAVLAAVGLWYDDYDPATSPSPVTTQLLNVITYTTGVEANDKPFTSSFPYLAQPVRGTDDCVRGNSNNNTQPNAVGTFFGSSNTSKKVGVFTVNDDKSISSTSFTAKGTDADGIYYDEDGDFLIQLNRTSNQLDLYTDALSNVRNGVLPSITANSTSDFTNGREIAVSGNKVVVIQDAAPSNGNRDAFVVYSFDKDGFKYDKTYYPNANLWGAHLDGDVLYAVEDLSNRVMEFDHFFSRNAGDIQADKIVSVQGLTRTHGITYVREGDIMVLTDIADAANASDGAIIVINDFASKANDLMIATSEQIRVAGPKSSLGNPVDIAYDKTQKLIYVAERLNSGGQMYTFEIPTASGDFSPINKTAFAGLSSIYLVGSTEAYVLNTIAQVFASSNTRNKIGAFSVFEDKTLVNNEFTAISNDADGIYYDKANDKLYQVDRINNAINGYSDVNKNLMIDAEPLFSISSSSDFINGRGLAVAGDRLVVAEDAIAGNNNQNKLHVYKSDASGIDYLSTANVDFNLWGIFADINTLYAVVDNSNQVAIFDNFFANASGDISPSRRVEIQGIGRTHGLTYDYSQDLMILTDIGDAASLNDGAIVYVYDFSSKISDGMISLDEQIRMEGPSTLLGNPVDVAYDAENNLLYVAERAGGLLLVFNSPISSGDQAPIRTSIFDGISSVYLSGSTRDGQPTAVSNPSKGEDFNIKVYPNPVSNFVEIDLSNDKQMGNTSSIEVYDAAGRKVLITSMTGKNHRVNTSTLTTGVYFLKITNSEFEKEVKFIKN